MRRHFGSVKGLVAAMEEEAEIVAAAELEAPLPDHADSLETDIQEVEAVTAEGEEQEAQVEEAAEVEETLTAVAESLHIAAANGGISKDAAHAISIAVEHLYSRVGLKSTMPALESFGGTSSRIGATVALENKLVEGAKNIGKAIVEALKKAVAWLVDLWQKISKAAERLSSRADAIAAKAKAIGDKKAEKSELEGQGSLLGKIAVKGAAPKAADIEAFVKETEKELAARNEIVGGQTYKSIVDIFTKESNVETFELNKVSDSLTLGDAVEGAAGLKHASGPELPGGVAFQGVVPSKELKGYALAKVIGQFHLTVSPVKGRVAVGKDAKLPVLDSAAIGSICGSVKELSKVLVGHKNDAVAAKANVDKIIKAYEQAASKLGSVSGSSDNNPKEAVKAVARACSKIFVSPAASIYRNGILTGQNVLHYAELSVKAHGGKVDAPAKTEEKKEEKAQA